MEDMTLFAEDEPDRQQTLDDATSGEPGLVMLPSFQNGGRVEKTGLARLHKGEYVVPAEEAMLDNDNADGGVLEVRFSGLFTPQS